MNRIRGFSVAATACVAVTALGLPAAATVEGDLPRADESTGLDVVAQLPSSQPTWHQEASGPVRSLMTLSYDERADEVVLFGGYDFERKNDTWTWDGSDWSQVEPSTPPPGRTKAAMAYDSARGETVLFGGLNGEFVRDLADTWTFSDGEWVEQHPAHSPPARQRSVMAYDPNMQQVILFGGSKSPRRAKFDDTWAWDGTDWTELSPRHSPPRRGSASLAYDARREALILFGGYVGKEFLDDTWRWDGSDWRQLSLRQSPPPSEDSAHATFGQGVVLFGGYSGDRERSGDTWTLKKKSWRQLDPEPAPTARNSSAMAWDSRRERAVLFGGWNGGAVFNDTWTLRKQ